MKFRLGEQVDYKKLAHLHLTCSRTQPEGFMHRLGLRFMEQYYWVLLRDKYHVVLCAVDDEDAEHIVGFVSGTLNTNESNRIIRTYRWRLAVASLLTIALHPSLFGPIVSRYRSVSSGTDLDQYLVNTDARLAYWAVVPDARYGSLALVLLEKWLSMMRTLGAKDIGLEVDKMNPDIEACHRLMGAVRIREHIMSDGRNRCFMKYPATRETPATSANQLLPPQSAAPTDVRPAREADLDGIAAVHVAAFTGLLKASLGSSFLRVDYSRLFGVEGAILWVAEQEGRIVGFVAGYINNSPAAYAMARWSWKIRFAIARAILRRPWLIPRFAAAYLRRRRPQATPASPGRGWCMLSPIAVVPECGGRGIGKQLLRAFADQARALGAPGIYLEAARDNNEAVHGFYRRFGFEATHTFERAGGRWMTRYALSLVSDPANARKPHPTDES